MKDAGDFYVIVAQANHTVWLVADLFRNIEMAKRTMALLGVTNGTVIRISVQWEEQ